MRHPPPDLLTNPKFDRNKEMEFQGLHKGNILVSKTLSVDYTMLSKKSAYDNSNIRFII